MPHSIPKIDTEITIFLCRFYRFKNAPENVYVEELLEQKKVSKVKVDGVVYLDTSNLSDEEKLKLLTLFWDMGRPSRFSLKTKRFDLHEEKLFKVGDFKLAYDRSLGSWCIESPYGSDLADWMPAAMAKQW